MQIESILIFIVFVVISSMANRRKQAQQRQQRQQPQPMENQQPKVAASQPKTQHPSQPPKPARPAKRTLQDLFREMQQELVDEFKQASEQVPEDRSLEMQDPAMVTRSAKSSVTAAAKNRGAGQSTDGRNVEPSETMKRKSPIYGNEIKEMPKTAAIELTEETVLNGIIFSEILGKPKSMRR
ncbi:hypothetical protein [Anoxynatronum buryatiense]|uniref:Uncharacterized protein n=1 Tax=Anoxynatronum buryatiense TaxID=489973 RepID=A0AA46AHI5_9CLOT|nr:hypothetical protein [Anoxynatronum buryatiense]SMP39498.1 hypothetical protein SAMN06296020_101233 [Anoxynatronum buryatiense]